MPILTQQFAGANRPGGRGYRNPVLEEVTLETLKERAKRKARHGLEDFGEEYISRVLEGLVGFEDEEQVHENLIAAYNYCHLNKGVSDD